MLVLINTQAQNKLQINNNSNVSNSIAINTNTIKFFDGVDVTVTDIENPDSAVAGYDIYVKATVENIGSVNTSLDVTVCFFLDGAEQASSTLAIDDLETGDNYTITFLPFALALGIYDIQVYATATDDINHTNDTLYSTINVIEGVERNLVIIEDFTGTWCQYCPGAQMGIEDLIENGYSIAAIANHINDDYSFDGTGDRFTYYGISGLPTAQFDGLITSTGGSATESLYGIYKPLVEQRMAKGTPIKLKIENFLYDSDTRTVTANAVIERIVDKVSGVLVFHAVITESHVPEEWQGQTELNDVARKYYPSANGTNIDLSEDSQQTISITFTIADDWVPELMDIVVFVQNKYSKEIYNGATQHIKEIESIANVTIAVIDTKGEPIEGANVDFDDLSQTTGADGSVYFENVEHGNHVYHVSKSGYYPANPVSFLIGFEDKEFTQELWAAEFLYEENFNDENLPAGWYTTEHDQNWSVENSTFAGGEPNEVLLSYVPNFTGKTALISPFIPLIDSVSETDSIYIIFKHIIDIYNNGGCVFSVRMISFTGADTTVLWSDNPTIDMPAKQQKIKIEYSDITASKVYFQFAFIGSTSNFTKWAIDDFTIVKADNEVGISENTIGKQTLNVYPNPAQNELKIVNSICGKLNIYSVTGQCLISNNNYNSNKAIDVSHLNNGLYIICIKNQNKVYSAKVSIVK